MIPIGPATRIYLACGATDLRKSYEGLSDLVRHRFKEDPMSGHLFVFTNAERNRKGRFSWPKTPETETGALRVMAEELTLLLSGIDLEKTRARAWWRRAA